MSLVEGGADFSVLLVGKTEVEVMTVQGARFGGTVLAKLVAVSVGMG